MKKENTMLIQSTVPVAKATIELEKTVAAELVYNEELECLEELFKKGQKIEPRPTDAGNNN